MMRMVSDSGLARLMLCHPTPDFRSTLMALTGTTTTGDAQRISVIDASGRLSSALFHHPSPTASPSKYVSTYSTCSRGSARISTIVFLCAALGIITLGFSCILIYGSPIALLSMYWCSVAFGIQGRRSTSLIHARWKYLTPVWIRHLAKRDPGRQCRRCLEHLCHRSGASSSAMLSCRRITLHSQCCSRASLHWST